MNGVTKYEPEPWVYEDNPTWGHCVRAPSVTRLSVSTPKGLPAQYEAVFVASRLRSAADGHLMSAAPDMLEVLKEINNWCATDDGAQALPYEPPWAQAMYAAMRKAGGFEE